MVLLPGCKTNKNHYPDAGEVLSTFEVAEGFQIELFAAEPLISDPPNVLYFEDTDNDGVSDIRDTIVTGFALSNPQHNFNNPMLRMDNWIYIANEPAVTAKV